jgi:hypothetical protein
MSNYPTVRLTDLVPDSCNFKDKTFESYVTEWMSRNMPSIPLGMLDTESEIAYERWQIEPDSIHDVKTVTWAVWTCEECGEVYDEKPDESDECCYKLDEDGEETDELYPIKKTERIVYVVVNESIDEALNDSMAYVRYESLGEDYDDVPYPGWQDKTYTVYGWDDEGDAHGVVETADQQYHSEHGHEGYGFPWANNYAFMPDGWISDASLGAAGFRIATYVGGKGDSREDCEYRLAGIDGGGYSFTGQHFAWLIAHHHEERELTVETDNGLAYITTDDRPDLVKLAEDSQKEAS